MLHHNELYDLPKPVMLLCSDFLHLLLVQLTLLLTPFQPAHRGAKRRETTMITNDHHHIYIVSKKKGWA
jgi:hypothetical protein